MRRAFLPMPGLAFLATALLSFPAQAGIIRQYNFNAAANNSTESGAGYGATAGAANIVNGPGGNDGTAVAGDADFLSSTAAINTTIDQDGMGYPFVRGLRVDPLGNSANAAQAVANGKYWEFTTTAAAGYQLDLNTLTFDVGRGNTSTPRGYVVRSSADGFSSDLAAADVPTVLPNTTAVSIDLSALPDLSSITFRVYSYSPGSNMSLMYDNVTLNGDVVQAVPEPATLTLAGFGVLGLCGYGWRKRRLAVA